MTILQIPLPESHASLSAMSAGQVDAVAVWFDLHLDSQNSFSTAPTWDISWEQAVFPMRQDIYLQAGDTVQLHASCTDTLLSMEVGEVSRGPRGDKEKELQSSTCRPSSESGELPPLTLESLSQKLVSSPHQSAEAAELISHLPAEAVSIDNPQMFFVERSELCRWNDKDYIECYRRALGQVVDAVKNEDLEESESESEEELSGSEMEEDVANCLLLDLTHGLSPFGLMAAKEGKDV